MKTNELKKGQTVRLRNGWKAQLYDNKKGNLRLAKVFGDYEEIGSIYSHDIIGYYSDTGFYEDIELTKSQEKCMKINQAHGFGY